MRKELYFTVIDTLGLNADGGFAFGQVGLGDGVVDDIDNAANRTVGIKKRGGTSDDFDLLDVEKIDIYFVVSA